MTNSFFTGFEKAAAIKSDVQPQEHQKRVLEKLKKSHGMLLYHGLGSGKTLSSILASEQPGATVDVVVPASLRTNYQKELAKFTNKKDAPTRTIHSYEGATSKPLTGGDYLIADEIQRINQAASKRSQALMEAATKYKNRLVLTGTPIKNAPYELAPILKVINPEAKVPTDQKAFESKFVGEEKVNPSLWDRIIHKATPGVKYYPKNLGDLKSIIKGHVDYYEPDKEGYPSRSEEIVKVPMNDEQEEMYKFVAGRANPVLAWKIRQNLPLSKQESSQLNAFMTGTRMVGNTTSTLGGTHPSPKFVRASKDLEEMVKAAPQSKALVYSNYLDAGVKEYANHLDEKGISYRMFTGELSDKKRKEYVEDYNKGKVQALLISGAGSEGLDLKGTRMVQILEPHWNNQRVEQAIGRAIRYKSHEGMPEDEQHVHVIRYQSVHKPTGMQKLFGKKSDTSADEYLHNLSLQKETMNKAFLNVLKEEGMKTSNFVGGFEKASMSKNVREENSAPFTPPGSTTGTGMTEGGGEEGPKKTLDGTSLIPPVSQSEHGKYAGMKLADYFFQEFTPPGSSFNTAGDRNNVSDTKAKDVPPDQVPPIAYESQNLNSFYTGDERKHAYEVQHKRAYEVQHKRAYEVQHKRAFELGFEKAASITKLASLDLSFEGLDAKGKRVAYESFGYSPAMKYSHGRYLKGYFELDGSHTKDSLQDKMSSLTKNHEESKHLLGVYEKYADGWHDEVQRIAKKVSSAAGVKSVNVYHW